MLDMNRGEHRFSGAIGTAIAAFHSRALAALDDQAGDRLACQDYAVVCFDETGQRLGELSRASFGERAAVALLLERSVGNAAGYRELRGLLRPGTCQHEGAGMIVFEVVSNDVPMGHRQAALP